jgi:cytochrome oxidase assembly protein ShyY1
VLLLAAATVGLALLGRWQLHRADERRAVLAQIEAGRAQPPLALAADTPPADLAAWRPAQAQGEWLASLSVLLDNRNHDGQPGYWVATPLLLAPDGRRAVLVLRGWLPREPGVAASALPMPASGLQQVAGQLAPRVPRLFELGTAPVLPGHLPAASGVPAVQNLNLDDYARASGLALLPVVLMQSNPDATASAGVPQDGLVRDWPGPSVDFQQNLGYAMQWFAFAAIAAVAGLVVAWRAWGIRRPSGP